MTPDTSQNQTDQTSSQNEESSTSEKAQEAEKRLVREKAQSEVEKDYDKRGWIGKLTAHLSFRKKAQDIEKRAEELDLNEEEKEVLQAVYEETDQEADELKAVYDKLESKWVKLAKKFGVADTILKNERYMKAIGVVGGIWSGLKSSAIRRGIHAATGFVTNPVVGGAVGGALAGGTSAFLKEREKVHRAESWEAEFGEEVMNLQSLEDAQNLSEKQLSEITGVLSNAFSEKRVRDNAYYTLRIATKYRLAQQALIEKQKPESSESIHSTLDRIEEADDKLDKEIIQSASQKHRETYGKILNRKRGEILRKTVFGAIAGGAIGFVAGHIFSGTGISEDNANTGGEDTQSYIDEEDWLERRNLRVTNDPEYREHIQRIHSETGFMGEEDQVLHPDKYGNAKFSQMVESLANRNQDSAVEIAQNHNIDLTIKAIDGRELFDGKTFAQYLSENGEKFKELSTLQQWEAISHPDIARDIIENPDSYNSELKEMFENNTFQSHYLNKFSPERRIESITNPEIWINNIKEAQGEVTQESTQTPVILGSILIGGTMLAIWQRDNIREKASNIYSGISSRFSGAETEDEEEDEENNRQAA